MLQRNRLIALAVSAAVVVAACGDDDDATSPTAAPTTVAPATASTTEPTDPTGDLRRLHDHPLDRPTCAVTVISGTKPGRGEQRSRPVLVEAHRARAASLTHGRWVDAPRSGHMVMLTEPQVVIDEVTRLVTAE